MKLFEFIHLIAELALALCAMLLGLFIIGTFIALLIQGYPA